MLDELKPYDVVFEKYANAPNIGDKDLAPLKEAINAIRTKNL
jgi:hypothetical protein